MGAVAAYTSPYKHTIDDLKISASRIHLAITMW
jgi:hypothetical protein